jgi:hypothetical protein
MRRYSPSTLSYKEGYLVNKSKGKNLFYFAYTSRLASASRVFTPNSTADVPATITMTKNVLNNADFGVGQLIRFTSCNTPCKNREK